MHKGPLPTDSLRQTPTWTDWRLLLAAAASALAHLLLVLAFRPQPSAPEKPPLVIEAMLSARPAAKAGAHPRTAPPPPGLEPAVRPKPPAADHPKPTVPKPEKAAAPKPAAKKPRPVPLEKPEPDRPAQEAKSPPPAEAPAAERPEAAPAKTAGRKPGKRGQKAQAEEEAALPEFKDDFAQLSSAYDRNAPAAPHPGAAAPMSGLAYHPPRLLGGRTRPPYPKAAGTDGGRATVTVLIHVTAEGEVAGVDLLHSSGSPVFDNPALEEARRWHFAPATRGGMAVEGKLKHTFIFVPD